MGNALDPARTFSLPQSASKPISGLVKVKARASPLARRCRSSPTLQTLFRTAHAGSWHLSRVFACLTQRTVGSTFARLTRKTCDMPVCPQQR